MSAERTHNSAGKTEKDVFLSADQTGKMLQRDCSSESLFVPASNSNNV